MPIEQKEFSALYEEHYPRIVGYLKRLVGEADAEDAAQEAFVKISRSLGSFRGESSLSTWIYRIATNTALDHLRKPSSKQDAQRRASGATGDPVEDEVNFIEDCAPLPDSLLIRKDMNDCIRGLVNDLPEKYRAVLILSDLEDLSNAEIGEVLGLPLDTVKIRLHRARTMLKKAMDHACLLYRDQHNVLSCDRKPATLEFRKK